MFCGTVCGGDTMMVVEPLVVVAVLIVIAVLALLYGVDSGPRVQDPPQRWFGSRSS